jgi:CRISPR-associated protein Cmr4
MYHKAYGIIETLAPLHVGASAGEETGNLNLIFRDQFTQTGIIPGSSIRGRFRADMRQQEDKWKAANKWYGHEAEADEEQKAEADKEQSKDRTTEALIKFEYASVVWLPVFCPGQPVVWVTCPRLLKRYKKITEKSGVVPTVEAGTALSTLRRPYLFFNLGFLKLKHDPKLSNWFPSNVDLENDKLVMVHDSDISMIHEMALYRQTRVALEKDQKKVENFFSVEALPEGCILIFPLALKKLKDSPQWQDFIQDAGFSSNQNVKSKELYFGGLESIGFGRTSVLVQKVQSAEDGKL